MIELTEGCSRGVRLLGVSAILVSLLSVALSILAYVRLHRVFYLLMTLVWAVLSFTAIRVYSSLPCHGGSSS